MSVRLEEEDLANIKIHVLILKRNELVENVDPRRYLTFLRSKYVIDERDCDEIKEVRSRQASAEVFLDILRRKGSTGYDEFCNALAYDKTQVFLLTAMTKTLELLKAKVLDNKTKAKQQEHAQHRLQQHQQLQRQLQGHAPHHLHQGYYSQQQFHHKVRRVQSRSAGHCQDGFRSDMVESGNPDYPDPQCDDSREEYNPEMWPGYQPDATGVYRQSQEQVYTLQSRLPYEPGVNGEPDAGSDEPGVNGEPDAGSDEPGVNGEPDTGSDEPCGEPEQH